jgi:hypothetical protein
MPPTILNASIEIPKAFRIYLPVKAETIRIENTAKELFEAPSILSFLGCPSLILSSITPQTNGLITASIVTVALI